MVKTHTGKDAKGQFKPLSEAGIQAHTDTTSYSKGHSYYLNNAIFDPILCELVLRAQCGESSGGPYRVQATLVPVSETSSNPLASFECSCPRGGFCKHIVALLLTWLHHPERFAVRTWLMGQLMEKSREELLLLIEELLKRQPELESLVELLIELPASRPDQKGTQPRKSVGRTLDPSSVRSQVDLAFYNAGEGWDAPSRVAADLDPLCDIGKSFAEAGEWANAQVVFATIAEEAIAQYEELRDEGQISWILGECAAGLVACLEAQSALLEEERFDVSEREELLTALFSLWRFGHEYGGIETDIPGAVADNVTEDERTMIEGWLREEMRPGQDSSSTWHNRYVIGFLTRLKAAAQFSDEDMLEEYRNAGLYRDVVEKLIQFHREDEALKVATTRLIDPMEVLQFADQLLKSGTAWQEQAFAFVEMRMKEVETGVRDKPRDFTAANKVDTYRRWLGEKYSAYGKAEQALNIELARFQAHPDDRTYHSVQSASQLAGQPEGLWTTLRPRLLKTLEQQGNWSALVSIYLTEGEVGKALSALAEMERASTTSLYGYGYPSYGAPSNYQVQVAKAAEEHYPDEAIRLYKSVVQRLIDVRGRDNYQQAAGYLAQVKILYQKQGREPEWNAYISDLRNSNKSLRALKEELDKRGL